MDSNFGSFAKALGGSMAARDGVHGEYAEIMRQKADRERELRLLAREDAPKFAGACAFKTVAGWLELAFTAATRRTAR